MKKINTNMRYPYEEITLVLSPDWELSEIKPEMTIFRRNITESQTASIINDLMIYTYKTLPPQDLHIVINVYALHLRATGCQIIALDESNKEIKLDNSYWIKYLKNDIISETFFVQKNDAIYSITSNYPKTEYNNTKEMSNDLYEIVKKIY